ncbi:hypothetical protein P261_00966 [Lachnospiraceae bacterium TWA4]|nr:hypothetical protein P261_00966 [Lachnospiraceae bacterium TWA4]
MQIDEVMVAEKVSESETELIYRYGHLASAKSMTGQFKITKGDFPFVSTVVLEDGYTTRVNEMRIAGQVIVEYTTTGVWPNQSRIG